MDVDRAVALIRAGLYAFGPYAQGGASEERIFPGGQPRAHLTADDVKELSVLWKVRLATGKYTAEDYERIANTTNEIIESLHGLPGPDTLRNPAAAESILVQVAQPWGLNGPRENVWRRNEYSFQTKLLCSLCPELLPPWDSMAPFALLRFCFQVEYVAHSPTLVDPRLIVRRYEVPEEFPKHYGQLVALYNDIVCQLQKHVDEIKQMDIFPNSPGIVRTLDKAFWVLGREKMVVQ